MAAAGARGITTFVRGVSECVEPAIVIDAVAKDQADNVILECAV